ncbi:hypothetical protein HNY73_000060 [Argiope bruennichi]|uniref:Secreted protein n=1 Tax=Argiope bruennichi TaxID=94029 RepID=A0A8T0FWW5_ARGBR|nr:hypothetical protein HNY73_000060 [Argiope bruennichi]
MRSIMSFRSLSPIWLLRTFASLQGSSPEVEGTEVTCRIAGAVSPNFSSALVQCLQFSGQDLFGSASTLLCDVPFRCWMSMSYSCSHCIHLVTEIQ